MWWPTFMPRPLSCVSILYTHLIFKQIALTHPVRVSYMAHISWNAFSCAFTCRVWSIAKARTNRNDDTCNQTRKLWGRCVAGVVVPDVGEAVGLTRSYVILMWENTIKAYKCWHVKTYRIPSTKNCFFCLCLTELTLSCLLCSRTSIFQDDKQTLDLWREKLVSLPGDFAKEGQPFRRVPESWSQLCWFGLNVGASHAMHCVYDWWEVRPPPFYAPKWTCRNAQRLSEASNWNNWEHVYSSRRNDMAGAYQWHTVLQHDRYRQMYCFCRGFLRAWGGVTLFVLATDFPLTITAAEHKPQVQGRFSQCC